MTLASDKKIAFTLLFTDENPLDEFVAKSNKNECSSEVMKDQEPLSHILKVNCEIGQEELFTVELTIEDDDSVGEGYVRSASTSVSVTVIQDSELEY